MFIGAINWYVVGGSAFALILLAILCVAICVAAILGAAALKRRGVDITDGIDAREMEIVKELFGDRVKRERSEAVKARMVAIGSDNP